MDGGAVIVVLAVTVSRLVLIITFRHGQLRKQRFPLPLYPIVAVET
jgi:hypothetical protein